ncbi:MAG: hypothetical protein V3U20_09055 [Thermoplasmata archaeon]
MLAIALIFIMLFVSYAVIFAGQNEPQLSKNMVFWEINQEFDIYSGNVRNIEVVDLSDVNLTIRDSSSDSTNSTDFLEDGLVIETDGDFNCTFFDRNNNGKLDDDDDFIVHNASAGDWVKLYLKSTGKELAYYTF